MRLLCLRLVMPLLGDSEPLRLLKLLLGDAERLLRWPMLLLGDTEPLLRRRRVKVDADDRVAAAKNALKGLPVLKGDIC